jgi:predicted nucleotidyltransferase
MNADVAERLGLPLTTLEKLGSVFALHPAIHQALVYGSRAKGTYRRGSDIDLTLKGELLDFAELMQIEDQIDDLLLPYTVDLSEYRQLSNPDLLGHIDRVGIVIYQQQPAIN